MIILELGGRETECASFVHTHKIAFSEKAAYCLRLYTHTVTGNIPASPKSKMTTPLAAAGFLTAARAQWCLSFNTQLKLLSVFSYSRTEQCAQEVVLPISQCVANPITSVNRHTHTVKYTVTLASQSWHSERRTMKVPPPPTPPPLHNNLSATRFFNTLIAGVHRLVIVEVVVAVVVVFPKWRKGHLRRKMKQKSKSVWAQK